MHSIGPLYAAAVCFCVVGLSGCSSSPPAPKKADPAVAKAKIDHALDMFSKLSASDRIAAAEEIRPALPEATPEQRERFAILLRGGAQVPDSVNVAQSPNGIDLSKP